MNSGLRILILEDVVTDAELMEFELQGAGLAFVSQRVADKAPFIEALESFCPDIILSDYSLPSFDGLSALTIAQAKSPEVPFIFVSGALGEETAIELLKKGATDYVLKNRLSRLAPAVSRALQERREREELRRIEAELKESEDRYRTIFENTGTATIIFREDAAIVLANREFERMTGYPRREIVDRKSWTDFVFADDRSRVAPYGKPTKNGFRMPADGLEFRIVDREGTVVSVLANIAVIPSEDRAVMSLLDITGRKTTEEALKRREQELELKSRSLEEANTALKVLLKHREEDKSDLQDNVLANVKKLVLPYVENMRHHKLNDYQMAQLDIIEAHLNDIVSPFLHNLTSTYLGLTPREIQVANLVKEGKTTKEITELLNISSTAVDFHRKNLRAKFGIKNQKSNLRAYLLSLDS